MEETPSGIFLSAKERKEKPKRKVIEIEGKDINMIRTELQSAYINDFKIIELIGKDIPKQGQMIKKLSSLLPGMEVLDETAKKIEMKDLLNIDEVSITVSLRRIDNIVRSMLKDSMTCLEKDISDNIHHRDIEVNRLTILTQRVIKRAMTNPSLAKQFNMSYEEIFLYWRVAQYLEKLGDLAKRISRELVKDRVRAPDKVMIKKVMAYLHPEVAKATSAFHKKDIETALKMEYEHKSRIEKIKKIINEDKFPKLVERYKSLAILIRSIARATMELEVQ